MGLLARRKKAVSIVAALVVLVAAGLAVWEWPARRATRDARRALAAGRYDDAWTDVVRWVRLRPHSGEAQYLRAKTAIALGRRHDIFDGLKQAKALGIPEDRLAVLRALLDAQAGRLAQARPVLDRAFVAARTPDLMIDEALARVYLDTYDWPRAGVVLTRWADDAPTDPRPLLWLATVHRRRNAEPDVVLADYREALRRDPNLAEARLGRAEVLAQDHRDRDAADAYTAYLALRPDDPIGNLGAGRNARALGDEAGAARHFDRALELDPDSAPAHLERSQIDLQRGAPDAALAHLDRVVALAPFDQTAHYQRSLALKRLGRNGDAAEEHRAFTRLQQDRRRLDDLQESLDESPRDTRLQNQIARWMFDHGYDDEGLQWSRKILTDAPGQPDTCRLLADYYDRKGQPEQAALYRRQASH